MAKLFNLLVFVGFVALVIVARFTAPLALIMIQNLLDRHLGGQLVDTSGDTNRRLATVPIAVRRVKAFAGDQFALIRQERVEGKGERAILLVKDGVVIAIAFQLGLSFATDFSGRGSIVLLSLFGRVASSHR